MGNGQRQELNIKRRTLESDARKNLEVKRCQKERRKSKCEWTSELQRKQIPHHDKERKRKKKAVS